MRVHDHNEMCDDLRTAEPTCADELSELIRLADRAIVTLTGPTFPYLAPTDAAHALMVAAVMTGRSRRRRRRPTG